MPNIFKRFMKPAAVNYVFTDANELTDDDEALVGEAAAETLTDFDSAFDEDFAADFDGDFEHVEGPARVGQEQTAETEPAPEEEERPATPVDFARVQAEAILAAARLEAEQIKEQALKDAEAEVHELYRAARADGYNGGFTEGMAAAMSEAQAEIARQAEAQGAEVKRFLDDATHRRDLILQDTKEDLRDLAFAGERSGCESRQSAGPHASPFRGRGRQPGNHRASDRRGRGRKLYGHERRYTADGHGSERQNRCRAEIYPEPGH